MAFTKEQVRKVVTEQFEKFLTGFLEEWDDPNYPNEEVNTEDKVWWDFVYQLGEEYGQKIDDWHFTLGGTLRR